MLKIPPPKKKPKKNQKQPQFLCPCVSKWKMHRIDIQFVVCVDSVSHVLWNCYLAWMTTHIFCVFKLFLSEIHDGCQYRIKFNIGLDKKMYTNILLRRIYANINWVNWWSLDLSLTKFMFFIDKYSKKDTTTSNFNCLCRWRPNFNLKLCFGDLDGSYLFIWAWNQAEYHRFFASRHALTMRTDWGPNRTTNGMTSTSQ